jgi:serine protease AprX
VFYKIKLKKMKWNLLQVLAFFAVAQATAQSDQDKLKIQGSYDEDQIKILNASLEIRADEKRNRVAEYVAKYPSTRVDYFAGGRQYHMVDVVDNTPVYYATDNATEAGAIRVNRLYPGGSLGLSLEGLGLDAGVWDGGWIRPTHNQFQLNGVSRVTIQDGVGGTYSQHGTHVGGTVGASGTGNASLKGMAPKVNILSYDWDNDMVEVSQRAQLGLLVSNHSYGIPISNDQGQATLPSWYPGCYNNDARDWDGILYTYPYYLHVKSAGNEGITSYSGGLGAGMDKLTAEANCKNNLVVANANTTANPPLYNITALSINPSSSQGPTDDGRIKPDITADGTQVASTSSENDTASATLTGTSMASPGVTGAIVLLQQHYNNLNSGAFMKSATVKALVCGTALDDNSIAGPDYTFGWGLFDAEAAANVITKSKVNQNMLLETSLANGATNTFTVTLSAPSTIKATLCWTDPAGVSKQGVSNSPTPALVNDLDIRITKANDTYFPWKLNLADLSSGAIKGDNIVDTVERVDVVNAPAGTYTITVSHKGTLSTASQDYSLVVNGNNMSTLGTTRNSISGVFVWPNPANEIINVQLPENIQNGTICLFDYTGRQVYQQNVLNGNDINSIPTGSFASGVYLLKVNSGSKTHVEKVIIQ